MGLIREFNVFFAENPWDLGGIYCLLGWSGGFGRPLADPRDFFLGYLLFLWACCPGGWASHVDYLGEFGIFG